MLYIIFSRQNSFGLTIALDDDLSSSGKLFWDQGDGNQAMHSAYMSHFTFEDVSNIRWKLKKNIKIVAFLTFFYLD